MTNINLEKGKEERKNLDKESAKAYIGENRRLVSIFQTHILFMKCYV